jgi:hypothetical protein
METQSNLQRSSFCLQRVLQRIISYPLLVQGAFLKSLSGMVFHAAERTLSTRPQKGFRVVPNLVSSIRPLLFQQVLWQVWPEELAIRNCRRPTSRVLNVSERNVYERSDGRPLLWHQRDLLSDGLADAIGTPIFTRIICFRLPHLTDTHAKSTIPRQASLV